MIEDPEVYYSCSDCVLSFVKDASNGVYVEATTDHARCSTGCRAKATFVCRVYPDEPVSEQGDDQKGQSGGPSARSEGILPELSLHDGDGGDPLQGSRGHHAGSPL